MGGACLTGLLRKLIDLWFWRHTGRFADLPNASDHVDCPTSLKDFQQTLAYGTGLILCVGPPLRGVAVALVFVVWKWGAHGATNLPDEVLACSDKLSHRCFTLLPVV